MNILYLCDEYPPGQHGGIGTSVQLLARQMVKAGHKVIVAGLYSPGYGGADEFYDQGVKVYRFRWVFDGKWSENRQALPVRATSRILKATGLMQWDIKKSLAAYKQHLEKLIADNAIAIVEMPDYNDYVRFCTSYTPFPALPVPVVIKMNGSITYFAMEANKPVAAHIVKMEQHILKQAAAVASVSRYTAAKSAVYLAYPHTIEVIPNGINTNITTRSVYSDAQQVIFTGTLVQKKGIYQLAKAWNIVNKSRPGAKLLVLGKGNQQQVIACLTTQALPTVSFLGHVGTETLYEHLCGAAIAVFPSYAEAFALAPLEAMACAAAVINSNRTSGPELVEDKVNGLLVNPDDVEQIAAAILTLLNNTETCQKLAQNGNISVHAHFEISKIARQNIKFYEKVLGIG